MKELGITMTPENIRLKIKFDFLFLLIILLLSSANSKKIIADPLQLHSQVLPAGLPCVCSDGSVFYKKEFSMKIYKKKNESYNHYLKRRLLEHIVVNKDTGCWEWQCSLNWYGYGTMTLNHESGLVHRISYRLFKGEISSFCVLHKCDNTKCINPEHLFLGTRSDNMKDCYNKGRSSIKPVHFYGEKNPMAKLNKKQVNEIRQLNLPQSQIAKRYNISRSNVSFIKTGKRWKEKSMV